MDSFFLSVDAVSTIKTAGLRRICAIEGAIEPDRGASGNRKTFNHVRRAPPNPVRYVGLGMVRRSDSDPSATSFDLAARGVFEDLCRGDVPASADVGILLNVLRSSFLRFRLPEADADDAAQEILYRVVARGPDLLDVRNPPAYLMRLARNRAIDEFRRGRRSDVELPEELVDASHDDAVAAMLNATATAAGVRAALDDALAAGDHIALRVVSTWLDAAEELGTEPTSREVAARAGVSHTTVNQALRRFRTYFPDEGRQTS